jgi:polar amino acid transport system ATP-binding protein
MDAAPMTECLTISNAHVSYGETQVLTGLNFAIADGEIVAIMGRSGCGKTTLLRSICALLPLQEGEVVFQGQKIVRGGESLFEEWEIRRKIMYVAQTPTLLPHLTALRNISLGLQLVRGLSYAEATSQTRDAAAELNLGSKIHRYPEELSGGEAQRVQLLRAMVLQPEVLLLDEITANIDPETTKEVVETLWLIRKRSRRGQAMVIVTHIVDFAEHFADRIAFMNEGIIYEEGPAATFRHSAKGEATRRFLASTIVPLSDAGIEL